MTDENYYAERFEVQIAELKRLTAQREKYEKVLAEEARAAGKFADFDDNLRMTGDWGYADESWTRYVGPRLRLLWNNLPSELRHALADDFCERADRDWSDSIDAMGEDA